MKRTLSSSIAGVATGISVLSLGAVLASSTASAQRVVVFGDSLSDNGNLPAPFAPPAPPYGLGPNGAYRFSSGLNWVDILYGPAGRPLAGGIPNPAIVNSGNVDLAFGGARTDSLLNPFNPAATTPGMPTQISTFFALGGKLGANDTVTVWGGANNIFQYLVPVNPALANPATAPAAIAGNSIAAATSELSNPAGSIQSLVANGAKRIVVLNLPDFGSLPAYNAQVPSIVQGASLASTTFNATLAAGLGQVAAAAPGVNIIQADIASAFRLITANPRAFGFSNVTGSCFNSTTFAVCANPNTYLFWDSVHPTQAGYSLVAQYVGLLTNPAPALQQVSRLGESGIYSNEMISNAVFDRLSGFISGAYVAKNGPFVEILGSYATYDSAGGAPGLSQAIGGFRAGIDKKSGASLTGASVSYIDGSQSSGAVKNDISSWRADVYATANFGNAYVSGDAGISSLSLDGIKRDTGFPGVVANGSTSGYVATAAAEAGYIAQMGGLAVIPSGRVTYYHSQVNAYSETAPILAMDFADRQIDAVSLGGKVRVAANVPGLGMAAVGFGEVGYEGFVSSSSSALKSTFVNNTALPTIVNPGDVLSPGILGKVGLSTQISANAFIDFQYGISVHDDGGQTHSGDLRIKATY